MASIKRRPDGKWRARYRDPSGKEHAAHFATNAHIAVKWPNDVYLGGRKVCGILSESVPGWRERLVVGVGVNVNNSVEGSAFGVQGRR